MVSISYIGQHLANDKDPEKEKEKYERILVTTALLIGISFSTRLASYYTLEAFNGKPFNHCTLLGCRTKQAKE